MWEVRGANRLHILSSVMEGEREGENHLLIQGVPNKSRAKADQQISTGSWPSEQNKNAHDNARDPSVSCEHLWACMCYVCACMFESEQEREKAKGERRKAKGER